MGDIHLYYQFKFFIWVAEKAMSSLSIMPHGGNGTNLSFGKFNFFMGTKISKRNLLLWIPMKSRVSNVRRFGLGVEGKINEIFMPTVSSP